MTRLNAAPLVAVSIIVAAGMLLVASATGAPAKADGGPHGGYTSTTDGCAGCHRAHTAQAPKLLTQPAVQLCLTCHGNGATGADTNVLDGIYVDTAVRDGVTEAPPEGIAGRGLRGGGFLNALMDTDLAAATVATSQPATSAHTYDGAAGTAWGNGAIGSGPGLSYELTCVSCHDPHGNNQYRILRPIPTDSGAATGVDVADEPVKLYTVASATSYTVAGQYFGEGYMGFGDPLSPASHPIRAPYTAMSDWCAQCHTRYLPPLSSTYPTGENSASTYSGDPIFAYRHFVGDKAVDDGNCNRCHVPGGAGGEFPIPPPVTFDDGQFRHSVECMTCHVAHGSSASMLAGGWSEAVPYPDGSVPALGSSARSSLLRVDGRGVCQGCHNK